LSCTGSSVEVEAAKGQPAEFVLANGGGIAYGEIRLDRTSLDWLTHHLAQPTAAAASPHGVRLDDITRGSAWVTLWDALLAGDMKADAFLSLAIDALPSEPNELNVGRILSYLRSAYWQYSEPGERRALAPRLERVLRAGVERAPTQTLKSAWFGALRDVAQTPATVAWLTQVWNGADTIRGLTLAEPDFIRLAEEIAVRGGPDAASIVERQIARTTNHDRKAQLVFIRPALSANPADRDAWFASLADVANRRHEPWVLEGLRYLHHPLRGAESEKYIEASLVMLREIQRTGDIFFPKRWMDATLNGHSTRAAAVIVRSFLARQPPDYPERLRRIILSSADDLFRAAGETRHGDALRHHEDR